MKITDTCNCGSRFECDAKKFNRHLLDAHAYWIGKHAFCREIWAMKLGVELKAKEQTND